MAGVNDITILSGIIAFLLVLAVSLPYIQEEFGEEVTNNDTDGLVDTTVNTANVLGADVPLGYVIWINILTLPFWTFGDLPIWINLILLLPIRIILVLVIARNIWVGGGA